MYKFFKENEIVGLDPRLVARLDTARALANIPFIITSGFRTAQQNTEAGGVQNSAHLRGLAVDLAVSNDFDRFIIQVACVSAGFKRIGVYTRHIHVDIDDSLPQNVLWLGIDK